MLHAPPVWVSFFVILLLFSVLQLRLGVLLSLCGALCARVRVLCRFTCTYHVQIFCFLLCCCAFKNMYCSPIRISLCLVFAAPLAYAFICTRPNRFVSICTHLCHFLSTLPKHDVRGNFPDHMIQILVFKTVKPPLLCCFRVPRVPCTPSHSSAPIRAHLHLLAPVYTLNCNRYNVI